MANLLVQILTSISIVLMFSSIGVKQTRFYSKLLDYLKLEYQKKTNSMIELENETKNYQFSSSINKRKQNEELKNLNNEKQLNLIIEKEFSYK
jgi:hypothetical protein